MDLTMLASQAFRNQLHAEGLRIKEAAERQAIAAETQGYGRHPQANKLIDLIRQ